MYTSFFKKHFFAVGVGVLILIRLVLNSGIPLMDKTEARYAEIARIMAETNDYITPQIDYNIPFWAKPPLSTWLSALSIEVFGTNEFAVRLPYLLVAILCVFLIGKYATRKKLSFFLPGFIALTIPQFLIHAGVVSTDTLLMFCVTLVMLSFWEGINSSKKTIYNYLLFVGLGLGLLAKGPIVAILTLPPIFLWCLFTKNFINAIKKFNLIIGIPIMLLIALPWYYLAENKTPGFIDYFIVGEHFKRFFDSSWSGDKYGFPKQQPLGIIWVFLLVFALPWIQVALGKIWKYKKAVAQNKWVSFLLLWLLFTPLFFTVSKSLIHPYIMPVMIPVALLVTEYWNTIKQQKLNIAISLIIPVAACITFLYAISTKLFEQQTKTDKYIIENNISKNIPIYYLGEKTYSSQFYSKGKIKSISTKKLEEITKTNASFYIIASKNNSTVLQNTYGLNAIATSKKSNLFKH